MATKTFTTGEVLTASDTNTFLANSGLVYIAGGTYSGATSYSFNSCFTNTYTSYRIQVTTSAVTAPAGLLYFRYRVGGSDLNTNVYQSARWFFNAGNGSAFGGSAATSGHPIFVLSTSTNGSSSAIDVHNPFTTVSWKTLHADGIGNDNGGGIYREVGAATTNQSTQYDGFSLVSASGNWTGLIRIYGYRQA